MTGSPEPAVPPETALLDPLAHGIAGRQDLPIPFSYALAGSAMALLVSFAVLGFAWRTSRFRKGRAGFPVPQAIGRIADSSTWFGVLRVIGLLATGYVALAAVGGPTGPSNPMPGIVYVWFWVGMPLASVVFGPVWRALNPLRTLHAAIIRLADWHPGGSRGSEATASAQLPLPEWVGYWPAAAGLTCFVWMELVAANGATVPALRVFLLAYGGVHLVAAMIFGARWFDRADAFEAYSSLLAALSPFGRRDDGRLVVRRPLEGLDAIRPAPGLVAVVCVLLGSTGYDSLSASSWWVRFLQGGPLPEPVAGTVGLAAGIAVVAGTYVGGTRASGRLGRRATPADSPQPDTLTVALAHSVLPIVAGYVLAHYYSLLVIQGQRTLILASDPLGTGANWFGTAGWSISLALAVPAAVATLQVSAVVLGHVTGVVAAHDRAVRLLPRASAVVGQLPLMVLMLLYTVGGLSLLFAA